MDGNGPICATRLARNHAEALPQPLLTVNRPLVSLPPASADRETGRRGRTSARDRRPPFVVAAPELE